MLDSLLTLPDFAARAAGLANPRVWEYLEGGAGDDRVVQANLDAYRSLRLCPRMLRDVSMIDTSIQLFGTTHAAPLLLAPVGYLRLFHSDGEREIVRAADQEECTLTAATFATTSLECMASAARRPLWFQLYIQPDRAFTRKLVRRAVECGCEALVVTVDVPVNGPRDRELRAGFHLPDGVLRENLRELGTSFAGAPHRPIGSNIYNAVRSPDAVWTDIEQLREQSRLPVVVKGILHPADAELAIRRGAAAIVVSNHGGRALDSAPASLEALPSIASVVAQRVPILIDGGVRRGSDIAKALALGATAVMIGRPYVHGLIVAGAEGAAHVIRTLTTEFRMAMGLLGVASSREITRDLLFAPPMFPKDASPHSLR